MGTTDTCLSKREISESLGNMENDHSGLSGTEDLTGKKKRLTHPFHRTALPGDVLQD